MAQSLAKILVHTVFSTKDRRPFLRDANLRAELHSYLGGVVDHVPLLSMLARTVNAATMVKEAKRVSSLWIKEQSAELREFAWQNGYGIFSIGASQVATVRRYILNQEEHHRRITFQEEFRGLLRRYEIDFDERYVWD